MNVIEYVTEEVKRQGHDVKSLDGIERVGWMLNAWSWALNWFSDGEHSLTVDDAIHIGTLIEPGKNISGIRGCGVRVGTRICPPPDEVLPRLEKLWKLQDGMTPVEFYKEFEMIHAFVDGNGRSGKIIYNLKLGKLLDPEFPPHDLFGGWITNP
jgi:hypothetical protein